MGNFSLSRIVQINFGLKPKCYSLTLVLGLLLRFKQSLNSYIYQSLNRTFFAQRVVNVWNSKSTSVDFSTLSAFKRSLQRVNLNEFLTVYKFSDMYDCV